jgi:hypothetical protein
VEYFPNGEATFTLIAPADGTPDSTIHVGGHGEAFASSVPPSLLALGSAGVAGTVGLRGRCCGGRDQA